MSEGRLVTSTRWYWSDWMADPALRVCGLAARGLWVELLCIAGSNKHDYGFVSLNGRRLEPGDIAGMINAPEADVIGLLAELEKNGVFNRDRRGIIYCRRMVREEINRRKGRLGGVATSLKNKAKRERPQPSIPIPIPRRKRVPNGTLARESDWPDDFVLRFWRSYPKKADTGATEEKLAAMRKAGKLPWAKLVAGLMRYAAAVTGWEQRYIKSPLVWLNKGCWLDEYKQEANNGNDRQGGKARIGGFNEIAARVGAARRARESAGAVRDADRPDDPGLDLGGVHGAR